MASAVASPRATSILICNVGPESFGPLRRSYNWGGITIPACPEGKEYVSVEIPDQMDEKVNAIDHWAEHSIHTPFPIHCQEVVRDFFSAENLAAKGCFVPAGDKPTKAEIDKARETRRAYLLKCVHNGDAAYSINARIDDIPGEWKNAATELRMDREWCKMAPEAKTECPACAGDIKPGVAVCRHCGAILDRDKALKFSLLEEEKPEPKGKVI